jgi:uridine kinase
MSIGPSDLLIVEGVPALLDDRLVKISGVRIFVDVTENTRRNRLREDYIWRGMSESEIDLLVTSREKDEVPVVLASASNATHKLYKRGVK